MKPRKKEERKAVTEIAEFGPKANAVETLATMRANINELTLPPFVRLLDQRWDATTLHGDCFLSGIPN